MTWQISKTMPLKSNGAVETVAHTHHLRIYHIAKAADKNLTQLRLQEQHKQEDFCRRPPDTQQLCFHNHNHNDFSKLADSGIETLDILRETDLPWPAVQPKQKTMANRHVLEHHFVQQVCSNLSFRAHEREIYGAKHSNSFCSHLCFLSFQHQHRAKE